MQLSQQAIEPPGEARSNVWLFGQLAQRMGFKEACFRDTPEEIIRQALAIGPDGHSTNPGMEHITFEDLKQQGHIPLAFHRQPETHPFQPYTAGPVPTPSGKIEFYSEAWPPPASTRSRLSSPPQSRAGARARRAFRSNSWAARPTTT